MRALAALLLAPLAALVAAAAPSAADDAQAELAKLAAASPNGVITLDDKSYTLMTAAKRNFTAAVHFTALDGRRHCGPCVEFDPAWRAVSKAWKAVPADQRDTFFFGTLDFDNAPTVFQKLGMTSAPVVHIYPAGRTSVIKYDFSYGFDPAPLAESLSKHTPVTIPYKDPIDWAKYGRGAAVVLPLLATARFVLPALTSRWTWAVVTIATSLIMTSGFMFVRIRGMPWSGGNGQWVAQGYSNQYGQETQVVAFLYALLGASFLMLTLVIPRQASAARQRVQVYLWTVVIFIVFSILISLFRVKNRGYPFRLLI